MAQERRNEAREAQRSHESRVQAQQHWSHKAVLPPIGGQDAEDAMLEEARRLSLLDAAPEGPSTASSSSPPSRLSETRAKTESNHRLLEALNSCCGPAHDHEWEERELQREQASEFEAALAADCLREMQAAAKAEAAWEAKESAMVAAENEAAEASRRREVKQSRLPSEPVELKGNGIVDLTVKLPEDQALGELRRRFRSQDTIATVLDFIDLELGREASDPAHGYVLETTFPRAVLGETGATLAACGFERGRAMLLLQDREEEGNCHDAASP